MDDLAGSVHPIEDQVGHLRHFDTLAGGHPEVLERCVGFPELHHRFSVTVGGL